MANNNYIGQYGSSTAQGLAYSVERLVSSKFELLVTQRRPLLALIIDGKLGWQTQEALGPKVVSPVMLSGVNGTTGPNATTAAYPAVLAASGNPVSGVSRTSQLTPTPLALNDGTLCEYQVAHKRGGFYLTSVDEQLFQSASAQKRADIVQMRTAYVMDYFMNTLAVDLGGNNTDSATTLMGLPYAVNTGNVVGGINQATVPEWQSHVRTGVGAINEPLLDNVINTMELRDAKTDLILCSANATGSDLYGRIQSFIKARSYLVMGGSDTAKYGFANYIYGGKMVAQDQYLPANEMYFLDTSCFFWQGYKAPRRHHTSPVGNTDATETMFHFFGAFGLRNPKKQAKLTGATT